MYTRKDIPELYLIDILDNFPCDVWVRICYHKSFVKLTGYRFNDELMMYVFTFWEEKFKYACIHKNMIQIDIRNAKFRIDEYGSDNYL